MKVITVCTLKGGAGKTTTAENLATGITKRGYKVLVIDTDGQTTLTTHTGIYANKCANNMYTLFCAIRDGEKYDLGEYIQPTQKHNFDIIPGSTELMKADFVFYNAMEWKGAIKQIIEKVKKKYDYCIIDTHPSAGVMTLSSLYASNTVIIPMQLNIDNFQGLAQVFSVVEEVKQTGNPKLNIDGILLCMVSPNQNIQKLTKAQTEQLADAIGTKVYNTVIHKASAVDESHTTRESVYTYAKRSKPALDYDAFTDEFLSNN